MGKFTRLLNWFKSEAPFFDEKDAGALRLEFQSRYHQFKLLLNANNQALEIMGEIEKALEGTTPFGMKFIRSRTMKVYTRVYNIVKHLETLAPGKYDALPSRLESIRLALDALVNPHRKTISSGSYIMHMSVLGKTHTDQAGNKMANMGELANRLHLNVPDGFVVTAAAFNRFLDHNDLKVEIQRRIQSAEDEGHHRLYTISADIRQLIQDAALPADLQEAILGAYGQLAERQKKEVHLAVRSSALNEDRQGASFAGLYHSALNISSDHLLDTYKQIVAAAYSPAVMAYRYNRGILDEENEMCVGVIQMVDAVCGGVIYSTNPMDIRDPSVIINSAWGLPKAVVDGTTATDFFQVAKEPALTVKLRKLAVKEKKYVCDPEEGVCRLDDTGADMASASLTDRQALDLAALAVKIETYYGCPQDIEWAIDPSGRIILLQCRPLQVHSGAPAPLPVVGAHKNLPAAIFHGGMTASTGIGAGPVYRVMKDVDAFQFPTGAVLVTDRALARWAALLPRASALVSEKGSLTGHLANVAREFKVPALFGAAGVTARLTDQDWVTVDADACKIYSGKIEELLEKVSSQAPRNLMKDTQVYKILSDAAVKIIPLNLLDPDSPSFKAANCQTLHDITRFCHEQSVHEMFRFGKTHRFPERSSKQLRARIPMQWWVLNLDDGLKIDEPHNRFVDIDNVASIPMLALWSGITAFPWEGPPPVDGKGFMSVMFQATQNQALLPGVRTSMANRNYFMISRNYCSLQSRLGFHFATTEALVGERTAENYISFQFKGGAADFGRRLKRILFVQEILSGHGFRTEVNKDSLRARAEQYDAAKMIQKLKILGYLTIHTRQLDMIMSNPAMVNHYRQQIASQIESLPA